MAAFYAVCQSIFFVLIAAIGFVAMSKTVSAIAFKPVSELNTTELVEYSKAVERENLEVSDFELLNEHQKTRLVELQELNPKKEYSYFNENWLIFIVAFISFLHHLLPYTNKKVAKYDIAIYLHSPNIAKPFLFFNFIRYLM